MGEIFGKGKRVDHKDYQALNTSGRIKAHA